MARSLLLAALCQERQEKDAAGRPAKVVSQEHTRVLVKLTRRLQALMDEIGGGPRGKGVTVRVDVLCCGLACRACVDYGRTTCF